MKVLFAVSNEEISESIVKKYQKLYKQIISYKNVYYFNAILKELQKDKSYDRVVISEDLEAFTHTQYDQIDKFIFEKLDGISDEASNIKGNDIPIILICSDRRTKSEQILVKLFGIGIYNAIIGNDRSVDEVCRLINRPRVKKEAKTYYKIDVEDVNYQAESENDVSEMEIQNILAHYKRLGKNEDRYVDSFNNIAAQYNDTQLRIISKFLPLNVRAVLEEKSNKYQQVMSFNNCVSDDLRTKKEEKEGPSEVLLKPKNREQIMSKPIVIPSAVNMEGKKLSRPKKVEAKQTYESETMPEIERTTRSKPVCQNNINIAQEKNNEAKLVEEQATAQPVKRGRGRPRKNTIPNEEIIEQEPTPAPTKRGRGRPPKKKIEESVVLPGLEEKQQDVILPGFEDDVDLDSNKIEDSSYGILPGIEDMQSDEPMENIKEQEPITYQEPYMPETYVNEPIQEPYREYQEEQEPETYESIEPQEEIKQPKINLHNLQQQTYEQKLVDNSYRDLIDISNLLTPGKKIVTFVGTSKNGTSFIVNNIAQLISSMGVDVAILDTTKNRNAYYVYTNNEEELRQIASNSIKGLVKGIANGINVNKNLTVYTSLPDEIDEMYEVNEILKTLTMKHSLILIDTDFESPKGYFKQSQETYLVQTMDVLTIQPLTAFLKDLKSKNILDEKKLKVILNKMVRIRGIKEETIIGGMSCYNNPEMSFMTELFDKDRMKYVQIPFEEETYIRYLEGVIHCQISLKGYSKMFMQQLRILGNMVYPMIIGNQNYKKQRNSYNPPSAGKSAFTPDMNNTLDKMKNSF